ncbi:MAG: Crp/Fnr family transcriptional regulator [Acidobacteriota bacterium]
MPRSTKPREPVPNRLLAALTTKEYQRLRPHLESFTLSFGEILYEPGQIIRHVYFPNSGIVSLLSMVEERSTLEVGMVGNEGMVGISMFLGVPNSLNRALVQGAGTAMRVTAQAFRKHIGHSGPLPDLLRRYTHSLLAQISQTAACNRFHKVNARLARWLLITHDRIGSDEFRMTQEFLSDMLGVRREGVTIAARALQHAKLIRYVRGQITIINRAGLEAESCSCYEIVKSDGLAKKSSKR